MTDDYLVTVCSECLRASCWHYDAPCADAIRASTIERRASDLRKLNLESPSHYSRSRLLRVCGVVKELNSLEN